MQKRTIATVRSLVETVNNLLPADLSEVSFHKKGMDRYVLIFDNTDSSRSFGPMSCGEACEFLNGIIFTRQEAKKIVNKLEIEIATPKHVRENPVPLPPLPETAKQWTYEDYLKFGWTDTTLLKSPHAHLVPVNWHTLRIFISTLNK